MVQKEATREVSNAFLRRGCSNQVVSCGKSPGALSSVSSNQTLLKMPVLFEAFGTRSKDEDRELATDQFSRRAARNERA